MATALNVLGSLALFALAWWLVPRLPQRILRIIAWPQDRLEAGLWGLWRILFEVDGPGGRRDRPPT